MDPPSSGIDLGPFFTTWHNELFSNINSSMFENSVDPYGLSKVPEECSQQDYTNTLQCQTDGNSFLDGNIRDPVSSLNPSEILEPNALPATNTWKGEYNFEVYFEDKKTTSTSSWTYSSLKHKLYVNMDKPCPISFRVSTPPPPETFICATPLFAQREHQLDLVKRCLNHSSENDVSNKDCMAPVAHLIRCNSSHAGYVERSMGYSVIIPYENPHPGVDHMTSIYKFMCLNTCVGGINRRPIQVIFSLENADEVIGRFSLNVKICASPYRDRKVEESHMDTSTKSIKRENQSASTSFSKKKRIDKKKDVFTLEIRGKENYEILKKVRDGLELTSLINKEDILKMIDSSDGD